MNSMNVTGCASITMRARLRFNFLALFVHPSCIFGYSVPLENVSKQNAFFEVDQKMTQRDRKCFLLWRSRNVFSHSLMQTLSLFLCYHYQHWTPSPSPPPPNHLCCCHLSHAYGKHNQGPFCHYYHHLPHPPKPPLRSLSLLSSITSVSTTSTTIEFTWKSNTFLCESNNTKCSRDRFSRN